MTYDRLSPLSILAIKVEEAVEIDLKDVIDQFTATKAKKTI